MVNFPDYDRTVDKASLPLEPSLSFAIFRKILVFFVLILPSLLAYFAFSFSPTSNGSISLLGVSVMFELRPVINMLFFVGMLGGLGGFTGAFQAQARPYGRVRAWFLRVVANTLLGVISGVLFYMVIRQLAFAPDATVKSVNTLGM